MVKGERVWETGGKNTDCAAENSKETVSKKITGGAQVGWHIGQGVIRNNGKKCRKIGSKRKRKTEKRERERGPQWQRCDWQRAFSPVLPSLLDYLRLMSAPAGLFISVASHPDSSGPLLPISSSLQGRCKRHHSGSLCHTDGFHRWHLSTADRQ